MKIWVDDIREAPKGYIWCRSVNETINLIKNNFNKITIISLDHDAGDYVKYGGDYIKILDWLEEFEYKGNFIEFHITIHSGNPVGRNNMMTIIKKNGWLTL